MLRSTIVGNILILSLLTPINAYSEVKWIVDSVNTNSKEYIQQQWTDLLGCDLWMVYFKANDVPTNIKNQVAQFFGITNNDWSLSLKLRENSFILRLGRTF